MKLFDNDSNPNKNILPFDGEVYYYGRILSTEQANHFYKNFFDHIEWKRDEAKIFGKHILTKRKVAWYGNEPFGYTYSNATKIALEWTKELHVLKQIVERESRETYNSCLMNLYHNGEEGMAYHSDGEKDLKRHGAIASISLGAERKFSFKHKQTKERIDLELEHGSLLIMTGKTQDNWLHRLPPTKKVITPRINLTFRAIVR